MLHILLLALSLDTSKIDYINRRDVKLDSVLSRSHVSQGLKDGWRNSDIEFRKHPTRCDPAWVWIDDEDRTV